MFEYTTCCNLGKKSYNPINPSSCKLIKFLDENTISFVLRTDESYIFYKITTDGKIISQIEYDFIEDFLVDYIYIGEFIYAAFCVDNSSYDQSITIYKICDTYSNLMATFPRESYRNDMDYFYMFNKKEQFRILIIRHSRLYLYTLNNEPIDDNFLEFSYDSLIEIAYIDGRDWVISNGYAVNIKNETWEIYNTDLKLIKSFEFSNEYIDWLGISTTLDGNTIIIAADNADKERGLLCIYDIKNNNIYTHSQHYGFYSVGYIDNHIITTIVSSFSDIGGIMVFNKEASLKYALLKEENFSIGFNGNQSLPLFYQAFSIDELLDKKGLVSIENELLIINLSFEVIDRIKDVNYEHYALSTDRKKLVCFKAKKNNILTFGKDLTIEFYEWNKEISKKNSGKKANILDIKSIRGI